MIPDHFYTWLTFVLFLLRNIALPCHKRIEGFIFGEMEND